MKIRKLNDCIRGDNVHVYLMINKIVDKNDGLIWAYCRDKDREIKCILSNDDKIIKPGNVILASGNFNEPFKIDSIEIISDYKIEDFLPVCKRPIEDIMKEMDDISNKEFKSYEAKILNDYFFKDSHFIEKFKKAIGGVYNHHNYIGGLAEHTLGVMYLTKIMAYKYDARYKEIAILGAKLHDIGKIYEMNYEGPFTYTLKGSMQGHIVIGITMIEKAFRENYEVFSEEFKERIKGIVVQHHGKLEYGSPIAPRSEESYIVHYADYIDATMNKLQIIEEGIQKGEWSHYDKRIGGRLYL
ncbi:MAG: HD domain-containing protein [Clostridium sp.]|jgi:3'-5' exoribonuclease|nr:HD domain-containing protein [Clostridium sp.]